MSRSSPSAQRGGILVYALIAIAFLGGLASYLQTMSDARLYQSDDLQKLLISDYVAESTKRTVLKAIEDDLDGNYSHTRVLTTVNKYAGKTVYLFRDDTHALGYFKLHAVTDNNVTVVNSDEALVTIRYTVCAFNDQEHTHSERVTFTATPPAQ